MKLRDAIWKLYWTLKLFGYKVTECKSIIYETKRWHFVVFDGQFVLDDPYRSKRRLHLYPDPTSGRVIRVDIG